MKHSTLLKRAKKLLNKKNGFEFDSCVCNAVEFAVKNDKDYQVMVDIHELIRVRIFPYLTVTSWLARKTKDNVYLVPDEVVQDYRLRWMDSLIQEYKEAGK